MRMKVLRYCEHWLIIGMAAALLWIFINIWRYGSFTVYEYNKAILTTETVVLVLAIIFAIYMMERGG